MDEQELQEVMDIATGYFMKETGNDEQKTQEMLGKLAQMVQEPGIKLAHVENVLFLIVVKGPGSVEVHTMAKDSDPATLIRAFKKLVPFLKNMGVKMAYTYTEDRRFTGIARASKLPVRVERTNIDGKPMFVYIMEF
jgi:hypothetical protein